MMNNEHTPLRGSTAFLGCTHRFGRESFRFLLVILGGFLLYAVLSDAFVWAAEADATQDPFVQKLQLTRYPESALRDVLSRSEFEYSDKESWVDKLRTLLYETGRRILAWIADRLPSIKFPKAEFDFFRIVMGSFVVVAVLVLIGMLIYYLTRSLEKKRLHIDEYEEFSSPEFASSAAVRAIALKSAEQGKYRDALIAMFRYVLLWLDERGRLSLHQVKTNREVLESLKTDMPLRNALGEMIPIFNRVRYGNYSCDKHDYDDFVALCSRVDIEQVVDQRRVKGRKSA